MNASDFNSWLDDPNRRTLVMGVLNVTPDSFSDGGLYIDHQQAADHAIEMAAEGADLIDVGGESTRPGSLPIEPAEQIRRVVPVTEQIRRQSDIAISIDTTRSEVAEAALDAGGNIVNDISAGRDDERLLPLAGRRGVPVILMHMQGQPRTMQQNPVYQDVVAEVKRFLRQRADAAAAAGVYPRRIMLDPGIGFGKTAEHNLLLLRHIGELVDVGQPLLIGTSRKSFIGKITDEAEPARRVFGTAATVAWAVAGGAAIVRVHDVRPMVQVVRMIAAIRAAGAAGVANG